MSLKLQCLWLKSIIVAQMIYLKQIYTGSLNGSDNHY